MYTLILSHTLTCPISAPPRDEHKRKRIPVDSGRGDEHKPMHYRHGEPPHLGLDHKVPQDVTVPHKSFVCPLVQRLLSEVRFGLMILVSALERVGQVVVVGVVEPGSV